VSLPSMVTPRMNGTGTYMETEDRPGAPTLMARAGSRGVRVTSSEEGPACAIAAGAVKPTAVGRQQITHDLPSSDVLILHS
jgi:hypothetical protein